MDLLLRSETRLTVKGQLYACILTRLLVEVFVSVLVNIYSCFRLMSNIVLKLLTVMTKRMWNCPHLLVAVVTITSISIGFTMVPLSQLRASGELL